MPALHIHGLQCSAAVRDAGGDAAEELGCGTVISYCCCVVGAAIVVRCEVRVQ
jgi:hypothetical protein